jgi:hypothetical protein
MLHPSATLGSERMKTLRPTAVTSRGRLFEPHNPVEVAELEHAVGGTGTRAEEVCLLGYNAF